MTTALATITPQEWPVVLEQARMLCKTGFLPRAVDTPEKAIAIMMKGRELGIPAMYALSNIAVIQGKPAANAELMLALIYRDHGDQAIEFAETTASRCTINYKRKNGREYKSLSYTMEQARQAKLGGDNWAKYPDAMLRARCISAVARLAFPDSIGGMHTPEELGMDVQVDDAGNVTEMIDVTPSQPPEQAQIAEGEVLDDLGLTDRFTVSWNELVAYGISKDNLFREYRKATGGAKFTTLSVPDKVKAVELLEEWLVRLREQYGEQEAATA